MYASDCLRRVCATAAGVSILLEVQYFQRFSCFMERCPQTFPQRPVENVSKASQRNKETRSYRKRVLEFNRVLPRCLKNLKSKVPLTERTDLKVVL
jgi:hypothetical protein